MESAQINDETFPKPNSDNLKILQQHPISQPTLKNDYHSLMICQSIVKSIVENGVSSQLYSKNLSKKVQLSKTKQSVEFAHHNYQFLLKNLYTSSDLSPRIAQEEQCLRAPKPKSSFLKYEYDQNLSDKDSNNSKNKLQELQVNFIKPQGWATRRESSKIYNPNRPYIIKKGVLNNIITKEAKDLKKSSHNISLTSQSSFRLNSTGRFSHKNQSKENFLLKRKSRVARLSARPTDSTYNDFTLEDFMDCISNSDFKKKSVQNRKNQTVISLTVNENKASSRQRKKSKFQTKSIETATNIVREADTRTNLIRLQTEQEQQIGTSSAKAQVNSHGQQINSYISFLRERKIKLQGIMKVFDIEEGRRKKLKNSQGATFSNNLSRQKNKNKPKNKNTTKFVTDFDGSIIQVNQPPPCRGFSGSADRSLDDGLMARVPFKIKNYDDKTHFFLQEILSSCNSSPPSHKEKAKHLLFNSKVVINASDSLKKTKNSPYQNDKNSNQSKCHISLMDSEKNLGSKKDFVKNNDSITQEQSKENQIEKLQGTNKLFIKDRNHGLKPVLKTSKIIGKKSLLSNELMIQKSVIEQEKIVKKIKLKNKTDLLSSESTEGNERQSNKYQNIQNQHQYLSNRLRPQKNSKSPELTINRTIEQEKQNSNYSTAANIFSGFFKNLAKPVV